jgi:O-antigen ligase
MVEAARIAGFATPARGHKDCRSAELASLCVVFMSRAARAHDSALDSGSLLDMKSYLLVGLLAALMFVWPIPHTIALRNALMLVSLVTLAWINVRQKDCWTGLRPPAKSIVWLAALTVWLVVQAVFVSNEATWALGEINGQWLMALVAAVIGWLAVRFLLASELEARSWMVLIVMVPLIGHMLVTSGWGLLDWWRTGLLPDRFSGLTEGPDKASYLTNLALSLLLAEGVFRIQARRRILPVGNVVLFLLVGLGLFTAYLERVRNGGVAFFVVLLVALALLVWMRPKRHRKGLVIGAFIGVVALVTIGGMVERDPRWATFAQTAKIAWNTQAHLAWLNPQKYPYPKLPDGKQVDTSTFLRVAWFKEGGLLVLEHPLGVGFGRNAFGHGLEQKYGEGEGHSHSGLLDMAIGAGIPGAALWLLFILSLFAAGIAHYRSNRGFAALALILVTTDYGVRMVLDSIVRDHMLQQFMFIAAATATLMVCESRKDVTDGDR